MNENERYKNIKKKDESEENIVYHGINSRLKFNGYIYISSFEHCEPLFIYLYHVWKSARTLKKNLITHYLSRYRTLAQFEAQ